MNPLPVREQQERTPAVRAQNARFRITPAAVQGFDYYAAFSSVVGVVARWLSVWAFPWWTAEGIVGGYGSGAYGAGPYGEAAPATGYGSKSYGSGPYGEGLSGFGSDPFGRGPYGGG